MVQETVPDWAYWPVLLSRPAADADNWLSVVPPLLYRSTADLNVGSVVRSKRRRAPGMTVYEVVSLQGDRVVCTALSYPNGRPDVRQVSYDFARRNLELAPLGELPAHVGQLIQEEEAQLPGGPQALGLVDAQRPYRELWAQLFRAERQRRQVLEEAQRERERAAAARSAPPTATVTEDTAESRLQRMGRLALRQAAHSRGMSASRSGVLSDEQLRAHLLQAGFVPPAATRLPDDGGRGSIEGRLHRELGWPLEGLGALGEQALRQLLQQKREFPVNWGGATVKDADPVIAVMQQYITHLVQREAELTGLAASESTLRLDNNALRQQVLAQQGTIASLRRQIQERDEEIANWRSRTDMIPSTPENLQALEMGRAIMKREQEIAKAPDARFARFLAVDDKRR